MFWISCAGRGRCWRWRRWRLGWAGDRGQIGACTVWLVHHTNTAHSEQFAGRKYFASLAAMENISPDCLRKYFRLRSVEAKSGDAGTADVQGEDRAGSQGISRPPIGCRSPQLTSSCPLIGWERPLPGQAAAAGGEKRELGLPTLLPYF